MKKLVLWENNFVYINSFYGYIIDNTITIFTSNEMIEYKIISLNDYIRYDNYFTINVMGGGSIMVLQKEFDEVYHIQKYYKLPIDIMFENKSEVHKFFKFMNLNLKL